MCRALNIAHALAFVCVYVNDCGCVPLPSVCARIQQHACVSTHTNTQTHEHTCTYRQILRLMYNDRTGETQKTQSLIHLIVYKLRLACMGANYSSVCCSIGSAEIGNFEFFIWFVRTICLLVDVDHRMLIR